MRIERAQLRQIADGFAVGVVVALPWSTSVASILLVLWLLTLIPTLDPRDLRDVMRHPAAWLPVALVIVGAAGMLWADVSWKERIRSFEPFARLLVLPLLFAQFRHSERAHWVFIGFLVSCLALLAVSFAGMLAGGIGGRFKTYGVPVRDYIAQSGEFILCAAGLFYVAMMNWSERRLGYAIAALALAAFFLVNVFFVAPSRTALVTVPILLILFAVTQCRWTQMLALLAAIAVLVGIVWVSSPKVQERLTGIYTEVQEHRTNNTPTSAGLRVEFWTKALEMVRQSPLIGHGTGSIRELFVRASAEGTALSRTVNPHNQTLTVAIQVGLIGAAVLIAMWLSHLTLFFRGIGLAAWIGLAIVTQNVIGGLFNNHLFDFVQAWLYLFGVGVAGGWVMKQSQAASAAALSPGRATAPS